MADDKKNSPDKESVEIFKDYGVFGRIDVIDLSHLNSEIDYLIYAQVASK